MKNENYRVITMEDVKNFEKDEYGSRICPSGDYTLIKDFDEKCIFGEDCRFGEGCRFDKACHFGEHCSFGKNCYFDKFCGFGLGCSFGELCGFGERCRFGWGCSFGKCCSFGERCSFGEDCSFGDGCILDDGHKFEGLGEVVDRVIKFDYVGAFNDCIYFFKTISNIYVRCNCFFGTIAEFKEKINKTYKNEKQFLREYMGAIKYAKEVM